LLTISRSRSSSCACSTSRKTWIAAPVAVSFQNQSVSWRLDGFAAPAPAASRPYAFRSSTAKRIYSATEELSGKTVLVTGSTDGVGRLVARNLGQAGARVLVHGRDAERGARVVADIEVSGGGADFLAADLSALAEVRRLAEEAQARVDRLDILINNAGIGTAGPRQTNAEGFELRFAVNYLAGFLLTLLLVPLDTSARIRSVDIRNSSERQFLAPLVFVCRLPLH
jgi:hypothetical protein